MIKCRCCRFWHHPDCIIEEKQYRKDVESYIGKEYSIGVVTMIVVIKEMIN